MPLLVYYFHSFSLIFLLANLLIVPLSNFIIYVGLCLVYVYIMKNENIKYNLISNIMG